MRQNLLEAASCLGDREYQARVWAANVRPPDNMFTFEDAVDFVLNDIAAGDAPDRLVADVLGDTAAVDLLLTLHQWLEAVIEKIGPHGAFDAANELPEWDQVRTAATALRTALET
jgi:hypothetical protein